MSFEHCNTNLTKHVNMYFLYYSLAKHSHIKISNSFKTCTVITQQSSIMSRKRNIEKKIRKYIWLHSMRCNILETHEAKVEPSIGSRTWNEEEYCKYGRQHEEKLQVNDCVIWEPQQAENNAKYDNQMKIWRSWGNSGHSVCVFGRKPPHFSLSCLFLSQWSLQNIISTHYSCVVLKGLYKSWWGSVAAYIWVVLAHILWVSLLSVQ